MFGYILANKDALSEQSQIRYRSLYCGLCKQLHSTYGAAARLMLSYDMVFLILILNGMYEPRETQMSERCVVHPFKKQPKIHSSCIEYAADISVILTYEKLLDDKNDEKSIVSSAAEKALKRAYIKACARQSSKAELIRSALKELYDAERACEGIDTLANLFGKCMAIVFDYGDDVWRHKLCEFGESLGRFIYVLDAYADFKKDKKKGRYNPLSSNEDEIILEVLMGEVSELFEKLPIVQDTDIIRNIIYSGVWLRYRAQTKKKGEEQI